MDKWRFVEVFYLDGINGKINHLAGGQIRISNYITITILGIEGDRNQFFLVVFNPQITGNAMCGPNLKFGGSV